MNGNIQNESPRQKQIKTEENYYRPPPPPQLLRTNNNVFNFFFFQNSYLSKKFWIKLKYY